jgi:hypothetical protein
MPTFLPQTTPSVATATAERWIAQAGPEIRLQSPVFGRTNPPSKPALTSLFPASKPGPTRSLLQVRREPARRNLKKQSSVQTLVKRKATRPSKRLKLSRS